MPLTGPSTSSAATLFRRATADGTLGRTVTAAGTPSRTSPAGPTPGRTNPSGPTTPPRTVPPKARLVLVALFATALVAGGPGTVQAVGLPRPHGEGGVLTVAYDDGAGHRRTYVVVCGQAGGGDRCRRLRAIGGPVGPVAGGQACSMIYGGPQTAGVRGTWEGRDVRETYRRTNGCEVARWAQMAPVLPAPPEKGLPTGEETPAQPTQVLKGPKSHP